MHVCNRKESKSLDKYLWFSLCGAAVGKALEKENGELELGLFLRFLLGLSLESSQKILGSHFSRTGISPGTLEEK